MCLQTFNYNISVQLTAHEVHRNCCVVYFLRHSIAAAILTTLSSRNHNTPTALTLLSILFIRPVRHPFPYQQLLCIFTVNTAAQYDSMMNRRTRLEYNDNIATTSSDEPKHRGKGVVREFLQKLNKFNRETWRSSLALAVIGLITLGVGWKLSDRMSPG